ncbi:MAG: 3-hydroxyacyl-CoA dehydrogenase family protein [Bacteroidia bacterium]|jgi:3-hydroxybutyryl-CoA dehydrogenase
MKILVRGEKIRSEELKLKLANLNAASWTCIDDTDLISTNVADFDIIFDLNFDDHSHQIQYMSQAEGKIVFVSAAKIQLASVMQNLHLENLTLIGINALPGFINRKLAEVTIPHRDQMEKLDQAMKLLQWEYKQVDDRVGMVTPRIIFMIINEACYTVQEGTASMQDIDTSMKLGTNYPFGPFEWADRIGIRNVYETLDAMYTDTKDERYKICALLKTHYLNNQPFYN